MLKSEFSIVPLTPYDEFDTYQEVTENLGGILMSISVFVEGNARYSELNSVSAVALSITSLVVAILSLFVETGYYLACIEKWEFTLKAANIETSAKNASL